MPDPLLLRTGPEYHNGVWIGRGPEPVPYSPPATSYAPPALTLGPSSSDLASSYNYGMNAIAGRLCGYTGRSMAENRLGLERLGYSLSHARWMMDNDPHTLADRVRAQLPYVAPTIGAPQPMPLDVFLLGPPGGTPGQPGYRGAVWDAINRFGPSGPGPTTYPAPPVIR